MANPVDPAVARARFAAWVDRALRQARANDLTDRKIFELSGVSTSTFHRWRTQQAKTLPKLDKVKAFAGATGASIEDAMQALGMTDSTPQPTPEPPLPPEIRLIMRRLADPNTSEDEKDFIRKSLQLLAGHAAPRAERAN